MAVEVQEVAFRSLATGMLVEGCARVSDRMREKREGGGGRFDEGRPGPGRHAGGVVLASTVGIVTALIRSLYFFAMVHVGHNIVCLRCSVVD